MITHETIHQRALNPHYFAARLHMFADDR